MADDLVEKRARTALAHLVLAMDELIATFQQSAARVTDLSERVERAERQASEQTARADDFGKRMSDSEKTLTRRAQEAEQRALKWEQRATELENKAEADADDMRRRLQSAEQRATLYEQHADEAADKASRTGALETVCGKLLTAMARLPLRMEDAGRLQTAVEPDIPLYATHEWQTVMDAKLALIKEMGDSWQEPKT